MVKYSFVVPAYNVEEYLERCINSIICQTYTDYEIIIIDDGSTDNTGKIADRVQAQNTNKIEVVHQKNKGLGGARNSGIDVARGEYIVFVDSDDYISCNMLEIATKFIEKNDLDIFVFDFLVVSDGAFEDEYADENFEMISIQRYLAECGVNACNKIYKTSIFKDNNIRFPEKQLYEDVATTPMTALHCSNIGKVDTKLYYYYQREGSIINTNQGSRIYELHKGFDSVIEYYRNEGAFEKYSKELEYLAIIHALYYSSVRVYLALYNTEELVKMRDYVMQMFPNYLDNDYINDQYIQQKNGVYDSRLFFDILRGHYLFVYFRYFLVGKLKRFAKCNLSKKEKAKKIEG